MPSPFPGMDPYLEQFWRDIHARCIIYAADHIQAHLPADLRARVEERVVVEPAPALAEPLIIYASDEPITESFIEIIDVGSGRRVVTVIEMLSLANKLPGEGQDLYRRKQRELRDGQVNLVEIDFLRAGDRVLAVGAWHIPALYRTLYQVCVYRPIATPPCYEVYRVPLRERLPSIRLPPRSTDADVPLDLQTVIDQCYRNGGYDEDIDYRAEPGPPLGAEDAHWADTLLREAGRR